MDEYEAYLKKLLDEMDAYKKSEEYKKAMERLNKIDWKKMAEEYNQLVTEGKLKLNTVG